MAEEGQARMGVEETEQALRQMDATLTPEELAADTYLEWSDESLGRGVRQLAVLIGDVVGDKSVRGAACVKLMSDILKECGARKISVKMDFNNEPGRFFKVAVEEVMEPTDPRDKYLALEDRKAEVDAYYKELDAVHQELAALDGVGVGGYFKGEGNEVFKLVVPEYETRRIPRFKVIRTKREGETGGTVLARKEADEWLRNQTAPALASPILLPVPGKSEYTEQYERKK